MKEKNNNSIHIMEILKGEKSTDAKSFLNEIQERQERFQEKEPDEPSIIGISTYFRDLDRLINGLQKSHLIILGARTAMGKTALALNIAENVCFQQRLPVGIFSLEMSAEQLAHRMICSYSEVESDKINTGLVNGIEYQRIINAQNDMCQSTMIIDDSLGGLSIKDIRERAHDMKEHHNVQLLIIDYLQLIALKEPHLPSENRPQDLSEIARILKLLSRELNIPIICTSQLSRKVEERQGHRPMMSDLRDCGAIEDHADILMFLLRREYYDPYDKPGLAELIIAKNRHGGALGSINLWFRKEFAQFSNYQRMCSDGNAENNEAFEAFNP